MRVFLCVALSLLRPWRRKPRGRIFENKTEEAIFSLRSIPLKTKSSRVYGFSTQPERRAPQRCHARSLFGKTTLCSFCPFIAIFFCLPAKEGNVLVVNAWSSSPLCYFRLALRMWRETWFSHGPRSDDTLRQMQHCGDGNSLFFTELIEIGWPFSEGEENRSIIIGVTRDKVGEVDATAVLFLFVPVQ